MKKRKGREMRITLPPINNYASRKDWERACWRKVITSKRLLNVFTTSSERHDMIMRIATMNAIRSGKSYKQIGKELWLSPQTISSIKKTINENGYQSYSERSKSAGKKRRYTAKFALSTKPIRCEGRRQRTKYGTIYLP